MFHFAQDSWTSKFHTHDKLYHLFGSGLLYAFLWAPLFLVFDLTELAVALLAFGGGMLVEIIDGFGKEGFSVKDLAADVLGILGMWFWLRFWIVIASSVKLLNL